jgi:hypothetical protein
MRGKRGEKTVAPAALKNTPRIPTLFLIGFVYCRGRAETPVPLREDFAVCAEWTLDAFA